jgi:hypothetical protein
LAETLIIGSCVVMLVCLAIALGIGVVGLIRHLIVYGFDGSADCITE